MMSPLINLLTEEFLEANVIKKKKCCRQMYNIIILPSSLTQRSAKDCAF